jgi:tRNA threonylcarbamoyl adenosine modification protein (Sua5/YciO/YrdC/YwlC family)
VVRSGELVVAPVEAAYGLLVDVTSEEAVGRAFAARRAERSAPLPMILHNPRQLITFVSDLPDEAERLFATYWPGPLTVIFRMAPELAWHLGDAQGSVALRMPAEPLALMILSKTGPLGCAAAATAGAPASATAEAAQGQLGDTVALYLDGGPRPVQVTTVVDVSRGRVEVLREGAIPAAHIHTVAAGELEPGKRPPPDDPEAG